MLFITHWRFLTEMTCVSHLEKLSYDNFKLKFKICGVDKSRLSKDDAKIKLITSTVKSMQVCGNYAEKSDFYRTGHSIKRFCFVLRPDEVFKALNKSRNDL